MHAVRRSARALAPAVALLALAAGPSTAQTVAADAASPVPVNATSDPLLHGFRWRSIGPVSMGGRVDEIAVFERDPRIFYVGFATGGLWKTENGGTTFEPVFDTYGTASIGSVAVSQSDPLVVWVATGEANNRQSSSFGDGVYRSTDGGRTFTHVGLRETQSINRIVVHPTDPDVAFVAAVGPLFGSGPERGVFRTTDGGQTWSRVLYVDEDTGATDIAMDPSDPDVLYAATYQRRRTSWGFNGGGPGSGIWKSTDGGERWSRLAGSGLPDGTMGRIALDVSRSNPDVVYALVEVAADRPLTGDAGQGDGAPAAAARQEADPRQSGLWRSSDKGATWEFRSNHNPRPMYFSILRVDPTDEDVLYTGGVPFFGSTDGGRTFETLTLSTSLSGGHTFQTAGPITLHVDHHAIWINPANRDHLMVGNDGGFDVSYDRARTWETFRTIPAGQFYQVSVDMRRPYWICGGLQDNGSWCGPSAVRGGFIPGHAWFRVGGGDGFYSAVDPTDHNIVYSASQGGNMRRSDLREAEVLQSASARVDGIFLRGVSIRPRPPTQQDPTTNVVPAPPPGEAYRWNWNSPFMLSHHNPRTLYAGGNRLFESVDRGDTWTASPDLTKGIDRNRLDIMGVSGSLPSCGQSRGQPCILSKNDGVSDFGTITTLAESPLVPGILWVGTDDGNVQVSLDGNATWTDVTGNLRGAPTDCYVSRVEASWFDAATAYLSLDCHRSDDLRPYVYVTRDHGRTWESIASDLPGFGCVNVIKQDPRNSNVLYVGTEFGFFVSLDEGGSWRRFMTGLPTVPVDDVVVHPRDGDLVLGTHGRSVLVMDDVTPLQQLTPAVLDTDVHLFDPRGAVLWRADPRWAFGPTGAKHFRGENPEPGTAIHYYLRRPAPGPVRIAVVDPVTGEVFRELQGPGESGIQRVQWDLRGNPREGQQAPLARPGVYRVVLTAGGRELETVVRVEEDRWMDQRE